jgi:hypothetical protein
MFVTALYKIYVIWTFCCTGNIKALIDFINLILCVNLFPLRNLSRKTYQQCCGIYVMIRKSISSYVKIPAGTQR